ncbi:MAG: hemerythrin domain-containing protein [Pirellulales bacterium]
MAIAQRTVSINPAFLQEIKDDHHELRQLMHHTRAMLGRSGPAEIDYPRLVEMLGKLRDQLAMHLSLEEAFGYFDDAVSVAPHLSRRAERLRSQHFGLFGDVCRLAESAEQLSRHEKPATALARLAEDYRRFSTRFHEHESQECDLILEAFNDDIGTGD